MNQGRKSLLVRLWNNGRNHEEIALYLGDISADDVKAYLETRPGYPNRITSKRAGLPVNGRVPEPRARSKSSRPIVANQPTKNRPVTLPRLKFLEREI